jgi:aminopeptidase
MINNTKLSNVLVSYCIDVQPGDVVQINTSTNALPLVEKIYENILKNGGHAIIKFNFQNQKEIFYENANNQQLDYISPIDIAEAEVIDKVIMIRAQENIITKIYPEKEKRRSSAFEHINKKTKSDRWVLTLYPTNGYAQAGNMTMHEFETFYESALFLNKEDPIDEWLKVGKKQKKSISLFNGADKISIKSNLIDLCFSIKNRIFINSDGKQNMPSGEIYTSPIEESVNGYFESDLPNTKYGTEISGVKLYFKDGKLIDYDAKKGKSELDALLARDSGAKIIGEFGIGCNYGINRCINNILFDEKIGGTIHLALGQAYESAGGKNKSGIHLDLISDMIIGEGIITVDNKIIYKNGHFII